MQFYSGVQITQGTNKKAVKPAKASSKTDHATTFKETYTHKTIGFGVPSTSDPHHFKVAIPRANSGRVNISEYLGLQASSEEFAVIDRVSLERPHWTAIRSELQREFNARLKSYNLKSAFWKVGDNQVDRLLGKELCVLAWAVEFLEMENIPVATRNWLALRPEERWWLFGMTAMSTGGSNDGNKGWRLALKHALGDIAQSELLQPCSRREAIKKEEILSTLDLFDSD